MAPIINVYEQRLKKKDSKKSPQKRSGFEKRAKYALHIDRLFLETVDLLADA